MTLVHTHIVECNTFNFYVQLGTGKFHTVKIEQITSFKGTELEEDFPNGSRSVWSTKAAATYCKTERDCVNEIAPKLLAIWTKI